MFIQTEATPNPATLKFPPGRPVTDEGTRSEYLYLLQKRRFQPNSCSLAGVYRGEVEISKTHAGEMV